MKARLRSCCCAISAKLPFVTVSRSLLLLLTFRMLSVDIFFINIGTFDIWKLLRFKEIRKKDLTYIIIRVRNYVISLYCISLKKEVGIPCLSREKKIIDFFNYNTSELLLDFNPLPCNKSLIYRYPFNVPYMSRIKMSVRFKGSSSFLTESSSFFYSISSFSYSSSWIVYSSRGEN